MGTMKDILMLLIVLLVIAGVESFGWGYSYYGAQSLDYGGFGSFNPGSAGSSIAGAVLGKKK
ncbi:hypothetical protein LOAG_14946 [Loa loa]|uniref:Uncharacterized protein n=2 Tax=Loa loa TaxID=7209 RepID=A0A1I7VKL5_LOALO|nr:hypothetical protein LOAG_14946 [Loa loa]EFO13582.1 hypothetical protein LOAG_14946 [Loa loa]